MANHNTSRNASGRPAILFVDDEEKAQKYFQKACEADFDVLTASSAQDAIALLDDRHRDIGVLVTDQRMPGMSGTNLLQYAHNSHPEIVRILTTAYSDLDSAIEAVNTGAIFQYITKPWNVRELRGILLRAMDHFLIQRERDALLCEKLSVLQQMLLLDRARVLCVLGASLEGRLRFALHAVRDYLRFIMSIAEHASNPIAAGWEDQWLSNVCESETAIAMTRQVVEFATPTGFVSLSGSALIPTNTPPLIQVQAQLAPDQQIVADRLLIPRLMDTVMRLVGELWDGQKVTVQIAPVDGDHLALTATPAEAEAAKGQGVQKLLDIVQHNRLEPYGVWLDLLTGHFLAAHHGGRLTLALSDAGGLSSLTLRLPMNAETAKLPPLPTDWLEGILASYEL